MVWDLGKAMQKKEEFESSRLMDFEFRQRTRAIRLLLHDLQIDNAALARDLVVEPDAVLLTRIVMECGTSRAEVDAAYQACLAHARQQLIIERGDPAPVRLG